MGRGNFLGKGAHRKVQGNFAVTCVKATEPIEMPFGLWARTGSRNHELDWGPDPPREGAILGERVAHCKVWTFCRELCRNG